MYAQVRFPNSNHCRNRNCSLKVVPLCPSCGSCNNMDAGSPQPGTSIVVEPRLLLRERMVNALQRRAKRAHHFQHPPQTPATMDTTPRMLAWGPWRRFGGGHDYHKWQIRFVFVAFQGPRLRILYYITVPKFV